MRHRVKAAEIILHHGLPKEGSQTRRELLGDGGIQSLKVEFVRADGSTVSFNDTAPPAIIEMPFAEVESDATMGESMGQNDKHG